MTDNEIKKAELIVSDKKGIISETRLFQFLNGSQAPKRVKAVSTPIALTKIPCVRRSPLEVQFESVLKNLEKMKVEDLVSYYICELMLIGSCRISEILEIKYSDFKRNGQLVIRGKKGSFNKIIRPQESKEYLKKCKIVQKDPFSHLNRYFLYRQFKKYGIQGQFDNKSKHSVTHYFRQMNLRLLQEEKVSKEDRIRHAGHKSKTAITYYENNKIQ